MPESVDAQRLLDRVGNRLRTASLASSLHWWSLGGLIAACLFVLSVRLLGLYPEDRQPLQWLLILPAIAALGTWLFHRRVETTAAARVVDSHAKTDDLFLTLATLSTSAGDYQPLVAQAATKCASKVVPADVVPFRPQRRVGLQAACWVALAVIVWLVPTLDPLGKVEAATKVEKQKKELEQVRKALVIREEHLDKTAEVARERDEKLAQQMKELMAALRQMKPEQRKSNSQVLQTHRQSLNEQWKNISNEELREMLSQAVSEQQFGGDRARKMNEWLKELQMGKTDGLQQQLDKAKDTMEAMLEAKTPEDRQKLASQLRRELQDLKKFASEKAGSKDLQNALNNALKSLDAVAAKAEAGDRMDEGEKELAEEAAQALKESLNLTEKELEQLAGNAADMKQLEEALRTMQMAESLNKEDQLDGEQCENCQSLADYAEKYKQMMAGRGQEGEAQREEGGAQMDEDDSDPEGYKDEKSRSQIQAGKVLMSMKTKEAATEKDFDPEELRKYESTVTEIKSGVQAAIENEQIPPGYVDGIKGYFDNLESDEKK